MMFAQMFAGIAWSFWINHYNRVPCNNHKAGGNTPRTARNSLLNSLWADIHPLWPWWGWTCHILDFQHSASDPIRPPPTVNSQGHQEGPSSPPKNHWGRKNSSIPKLLVVHSFHIRTTPFQLSWPLWNCGQTHPGLHRGFSSRAWPASPEQFHCNNCYH